MTFTKMIQYTDTAPTKAAADLMLSFLRSQDDFRAGRVLGPRWSDLSSWCVQSFHDDTTEDGPLPDGCRRILVPDSTIRSCEGYGYANSVRAA